MTTSSRHVVTIDPAEINNQRKLPLKDVSNHVDGDTLVVDYGSYECRAGWASQIKISSTIPSVIQFENHLMKYSGGAGNSQYGLGALAGESLSGNKSIVRSAWDHGLPCHLDVVENQLDGMLTYLGATEIKDKNIMWSEPLKMPNTLRQSLMELFFEGYGLHSASYFNDSLAAYHMANEEKKKLFEDGNGHIISLGYASSTLIPLRNHHPIKEGLKRLPIGGQKLTEFLLKSMQIKYPTFPLKMTEREAGHVLKNYVLLAERYSETLSHLEDPSELAKFDIVLQYPYPQDLTTLVDEFAAVNEAALAEEKRAAFKKKMKQVAERKKMERLAEIETQLHGLLQMKAKKNEDLEEDEEFLELLQSFGYEDESDFEAFIAELNSKRNKIMGLPEEPSLSSSITDWSLINILDEELDEDQIKEKRKLKLLKAGMDARERQKKIKEEQQEKERLLAQLDDQRREQDFQGWLQQKNNQRKYLLEQIENLEKSKSRKGTVAQSRLRNLSFLAETQEGDVDSENESGHGSKKKRKYLGTSRKATGYGDEAEDWDRYRQLDPQEIQESLESQLSALEESLIKYDSSFNAQEHPAANERGYQVYETFLYGDIPFDDSLAGPYQLHFNVERFRIPEILFQPTIIGLECCGLSDLLQASHGIFPEASHAAFITGGLSQIIGLDTRLSSDVRQFSPSGHLFSLEKSTDPFLAPWKGAASWANSSVKKPNTSEWIQQADYFEHGFDRVIKRLQNSMFIE